MLSRKGLFGKIEIVDSHEARYLLLNDQIQGGGYLNPAATEFFPGMHGPGCVAASSYMMGWVVAGVQNANASGVMIGLGSGCGVTQMLYLCPKIDLTVVEIDPAMVDVATKAFPLLQRYILEGRLNIVTADASDYLKTSDVFDIGLADAYDGMSYNLKSSYMAQLFDKSGAVYANCIDKVDGKATRNLIQLAKSKGKPIQHRLHATIDQPISAAEYQPANWIMTSDVLMPRVLDTFMPFVDMSNCPAIDFATESYAHLISQVG